MVPPGIVLIVLEEGRLIVCDQNEPKMSECAWHREPIWAWEFCPIIVPSMELSLVFHPMFYKLLPVFHHIFPLMAIDIHTIPQLSICPSQVCQPLECHLGRDQHLAKALLHKDGLHFWAHHDLHNVIGLQVLLLHQPCPHLLCHIFIVKDRAMLLVHLVEREVPPPQVCDSPFMNASCAMCSMPLCLGNNL